LEEVQHAANLALAASLIGYTTDRLFQEALRLLTKMMFCIYVPGPGREKGHQKIYIFQTSNQISSRLRPKYEIRRLHLKFPPIVSESV